MGVALGRWGTLWTMVNRFKWNLNGMDKKVKVEHFIRETARESLNLYSTRKTCGTLVHIRISLIKTKLWNQTRTEFKGLMVNFIVRISFYFIIKPKVNYISFNCIPFMILTCLVNRFSRLKTFENSFNFILFYRHL